MKTILMIALLSLGFQNLAFAESGGHKILRPSKIKWMKAPDALPAGAQIAILSGNPATESPYIIRVKFPKNYRVAPHSHPKDETVTVLSGKLLWGAGTNTNVRSMLILPALSFVQLTAGTTHSVLATEESIIEIHGMGPFDLTYANPADDPRKN